MPDEIIHFTPSYNSQNKYNSNLKEALSNKTNRKSLALPEMFSDLTNV
jgi:hypothetical protein